MQSARSSTKRVGGTGDRVAIELERPQRRCERERGEPRETVVAG